MHRKRLAAAAATVVTAGSVAGVALAATPKITGNGVGPVKVGMLFDDARDAGLVGKARPNCPESNPAGRGAKLASPLKGTVDLTDGTPRRIAKIHITGGTAAARGVVVGDTLADAKAAYPKGKVDKSLAGTFDLWFFRVPKSGGGKLVFEVETTGAHDVIQIDVRSAAFCE